MPWGQVEVRECSAAFSVPFYPRPSLSTGQNLSDWGGRGEEGEGKKQEKEAWRVEERQDRRNAEERGARSEESSAIHIHQPGLQTEVKLSTTMADPSPNTLLTFPFSVRVWP